MRVKFHLYRINGLLITESPIPISYLMHGWGLIVRSNLDLEISISTISKVMVGILFCGTLYVWQIDRILVVNFICGAEYASQIVVCVTNSRDFICGALYVSQMEMILIVNLICGAQYVSQIVVFLFMAHYMRPK